MPIGTVCVRDVLIAPKSTTIADAARLMRQHHVGDLIVVDLIGEKRIPIGIVTDRDIVISVVATNLDPKVFMLGDLVFADLVTIREDKGILEAVRQMRSKGVRRMPVVNSVGGLVGIVTVDDMIQLLGEELSELGKLISRERAKEMRDKQ